MEKEKVFCHNCQYYPEDLAYYGNREYSARLTDSTEAKCMYKPKTQKKDDWFRRETYTLYALCKERNTNNDCPHWIKRTEWKSYNKVPAEKPVSFWARMFGKG